MLLPAPPIPAQSDGEKLALSLRHNVVSIAVQRTGGVHNGFGIIIGERDGRLFIATANHIVRGDTPDDGVKRITIRYFQSPNDAYDAKLLGSSNATYDLAVLEAPAPSGLEWYRQSLRVDPALQRGTPVWFIGREGRWYIPTQPGRLNSVTLDFRIRVDNLNVQVGTSGAPLLAEDGIIGMILIDEAAGVSRALAIGIIKRAFQLWDLPWDLKPLVARADIPALSPEIQIQLAIGDRFLSAENFQKAIAEYQKALASDSNNTQIILRIVTAIRRYAYRVGWFPSNLFPDDEMGSVDKALTLLFRAQAIDGSLAEGRDWLLEEAYLRRLNRKWGMALDVLEKAYKLYPDDPEIMAELGLLRWHRIPDERAQSVALLRRATAIRPENPLYHRYLGKVLELSGHRAEALRTYRRTVELAKSSDLFAQRLHETALGDMKKMLRPEFDREQKKMTVARINLTRSELASMLEFVIANSNQSEPNAPLFLRLAYVYYNLKRPDRAEKMLLQVVGDDHGTWEKHLSMSDQYALEGLKFLAKILRQRGTDRTTLLEIDLLLKHPNILGAEVSSYDYNASVRIEKVIDCGLAIELGLRSGDDIFKVNGEPTPTVTALSRILAQLEAGDVVVFAGQRMWNSENSAFELETVLKKVPPNAPKGYLGISMDGDDSVRVVEVIEGSPADRAGLRKGDRIHRINNREVRGTLSLACQVGALSPGNTIEIEVQPIQSRANQPWTKMTVILGEKPTQ
jgi:S1-C subfamily serine protease/tetratricopeptide (TPR) repeat protein